MTDNYYAMTDLTGKVALVTGGSRGIGLECATALRENGAIADFGLSIVEQPG
jgi:NAD(P)-dependent dehydrogenase (short-subunit alcohol dehydrogenase family)